MEKPRIAIPIQLDELPNNRDRAHTHRQPILTQLEKAETVIYAEMAKELHDIMPEIWKVAEEMEPKDRPAYILSKLPSFNYEPSPPPGGKKKTQIPLKTYRNGNKYEGEVDENGVRTGRGTLYFASGVIYEGYWKENKQSFRGRTIWTNGKLHVGGYKEGKKDGKGVYAWPTGQTYRGDWARGKQHGEAAYTNASGRTYDGSQLNEASRNCLIF